MDNNLFVKDKDIKISKSSFNIFENETIKYEGKTRKKTLNELTVFLRRNPELLDALSYLILDTISKLHFTSSRQITQFINVTKDPTIEQSKICKRLDRLSKLDIISKYSIYSEENIASNVKIYSLESNGKILLKAKGYQCEWKPTDSLDSQKIKSYLVNNQYIIKLLQSSNIVKDLKCRVITPSGISSLYRINDSDHVVIPVRRYLDYKEELINTFENLKNNSEFYSLNNEKIIILGEDSNHIFEIFQLLTKNKYMSKNIYFISDLRIFEQEFNKLFVQFIIKATPDNKASVVLKEVLIDDFLIKDSD